MKSNRWKMMPLAEESSRAAACVAVSIQGRESGRAGWSAGKSSRAAARARC
jgi:hypothetical protein